MESASLFGTSQKHLVLRAKEGTHFATLEGSQVQVSSKLLEKNKFLKVGTTPGHVLVSDSFSVESRLRKPSAPGGLQVVEHRVPDSFEISDLNIVGQNFWVFSRSRGTNQNLFELLSSSGKQLFQQPFARCPSEYFQVSNTVTSTHAVLPAGPTSADLISFEPFLTKRVTLEHFTNLLLGKDFFVCILESPEEKTIRVYEFTPDLVATKTLERKFPNCHEVRLKWSPTKDRALLVAENYVDHTGQSYYGKSLMFLLQSTPQAKLRDVIRYVGPIHDYAWSPDGQSFIVISGFMPAKSLLYNSNGDPFYEFGVHHKNSIRFSPQGRFLILGGFGNLNGEIEIWDWQNRRQIGKCRASAATDVKWDPSGRFFFTATTTPRLRVDNGVRFWYYTGEQIAKLDFSNTELYQVEWEMPDPKTIEDRPPSPVAMARVKAREEELLKKAAAFRPAASLNKGVQNHGGKEIDLFQIEKINKESKQQQKEESNLNAATSATVATKSMAFAPPGQGIPKKAKLPVGLAPEDVEKKKKKMMKKAKKKEPGEGDGKPEQ